MNSSKTPPGEETMIRCPRLGHQISFSYCRSENKGLPCFKSLDCWFPHFAVEAYFQEKLSPEQWEKAFQRPKNAKLLSLVELIQEAKRRREENL
ncbi:MAG: hypothetical protein JRH13_10525 [Deltaproteobacteria bacterium]|nr:hypothetical protein [Deltaproteobacteria bacterium]MBW2015640.1 hypothetical protein [Deltaproteobacteria bacterium]MBW2129785.1 hypothetical protein [Deltaproteobacteria bacterium]MBW2302501.1 hypothetical protein [Deltaproteobacteria bacterium]